MIKVKHPIEKIKLSQEDFLKNMAEKDRDYHSLLFSFGNAAYLYYALPIDPTLEDYDEWLEGLPEGNFKRDMQANGFESCKTILAFSRYVREKNDIGMDRFIMDKMGEESYSKYKSIFDREN